MPGTDLFFQYANDTEKGKEFTAALSKRADEVGIEQSNVLADLAKTGGGIGLPPVEPPPLAPDPAEPNTQPKMYFNPKGGIVNGAPVGPSISTLGKGPGQFSELVPSHVAAKYTMSGKRVGEQDETGFIELIQKGLSTLPGQGKQALGSLVQMMGDLGMAGEEPGEGSQDPNWQAQVTGQELVREGGRDIQRTLPDVEAGSLKAQIYGAAQSMGLSTAALLGSVASGGTLPLIALGGFSGLQEYGAQREGGSDIGTALLGATVNGMAEYFGERLPFVAMMKSPGVFTKLIVGAVTDPVGELGTTAVQEAVHKLTINPGMTWDDFGIAMRDTLIQSLLVGGAMGGAGVAGKIVTGNESGSLTIDPGEPSRTPGPDKGLTVNFTDKDVNALSEELLRGSWDKMSRVQTNDQTLKLAQEMIGSGKMNLDTFLNHDPFTAWPDAAHQVAAEHIAGGVFGFVKDQIAEYAAGKASAEDVIKARSVAMASVASWYLPQSEVARMLQARQMAITPQGVPVGDIMAEMKQFETSMKEMTDRGLITPEEQVAAMSKFYSMDQMQNFERKAKNAAKEPSILNQLFYFSLLSNPVTQSANFIGNIGPLFFSIAEQRIAETMPWSKEKGGAAGMAAGLVHSIFDAYTLMKRAGYTGETSFGGDKIRSTFRTGIQSMDKARAALDAIMEDKTHSFHDPKLPEYGTARRDVMLLHRKAYNPISADRLSRLNSGNLDAAGFFARTADVMGEFIDAPFKGLSAGDEFFKVLNYRMFVWGRAYEMAAQQGLEGDAHNNFVAEYVDNPPATVDALAKEFAQKQTFTNEPGEIGQALMGLTREYPVARFIVPFVKVVSNIGRFNLERTPFALALRQVRSDISDGGKAREMALAKMAIGTSLMAGFASLAAMGMITGGGPSDPKMKKIWTDSGWQEYSVKIGDTYYSYKRLEPFATPIGVAADLVEMARFAPDFGFDEAALVGALSFVRNFASKTYLTGISDFLTAITAGGEDTMLGAAAKYGKGLPRVLVPGGIAQAARVADPMKRQVNGWIDTLKSRIPGLSAQLEPTLNLKGDPITNQMYDSMPGKGFGMINPVMWTKDTEDPVWQEIRKNRVPVTMPSRRIGGGGNPDSPQLDQGETAMKLTPEQYNWLVRMAGNDLKDTSQDSPTYQMGAWDALGAMIKGAIPVTHVDGNPIYYDQRNADGTPVFTDGPDGGKAMIIQKVLGKYRQAAKRMLEGGDPFPEVRAEYEAKQTRKKMNQVPQIAGGAR